MAELVHLYDDGDAPDPGHTELEERPWYPVMLYKKFEGMTNPAYKPIIDEGEAKEQNIKAIRDSVRALGFDRLREPHGDLSFHDDEGCWVLIVTLWCYCDDPMRQFQVSADGYVKKPLYDA